MEITKEKFIEKVNELADRNWKVKGLLNQYGSYDNIPDYQRELINKELGVKVTVIIKYEIV